MKLHIPHWNVVALLLCHWQQSIIGSFFQIFQSNINYNRVWRSNPLPGNNNNNTNSHVDICRLFRFLSTQFQWCFICTHCGCFVIPLCYTDCLFVCLSVGLLVGLSVEWPYSHHYCWCCRLHCCFCHCCCFQCIVCLFV